MGTMHASEALQQPSPALHDPLIKARLALSAPDLLEALEKLIGYYIIDGQPSTLPVMGPADKEILAAWDKALAAIAKAEGRA